jgi:hypothetical protein
VRLLPSTGMGGRGDESERTNKESLPKHYPTSTYIRPM